MAISKLPTSASLKEVIDKFEEISVQDFNSINIKVMNSLPNNANEGDIVILCEYEYSRVIVASKEPTLLNNEIWLSVIENSSNDIKVGKIDFSLALIDCKIKVDGNLEKLNIYKYLNGKFEHINNSFTMYLAPNYYNTHIYGSFEDYFSSNGTGVSNSYREDLDTGIELYMKRNATGTSIRSIHTKNKIDLTPYSKLEIKYEIVEAGGNASYVKFYTGVSSTISDTYSLDIEYVSSEVKNNVTSSVGGEITSTIDLSNINETLYVKLLLYTASSNTYAKIRIKSISLLR